MKVVFKYIKTVNNIKKNLNTEILGCSNVYVSFHFY